MGWSCRALLEDYARLVANWIFDSRLVISSRDDSCSVSNVLWGSILLLFTGLWSLEVYHLESTSVLGLSFCLFVCLVLRVSCKSTVLFFLQVSPTEVMAGSRHFLLFLRGLTSILTLKLISGQELLVDYAGTVDVLRNAWMVSKGFVGLL